MFNPIIDKPAPDFAGFVAILSGEQSPDRVRLVELSMDGEIMQALTKRYLNATWLDWPHGFEFTPPESYFKQIVELYYHLGYDYAPVWGTWPGHPTPAYLTGENTAPLAAGQRNWVGESWGLIRTWEDFERFPWKALQTDPRPVEYAARYLHDAMKLTVNTTYFEHIFERLLSVEGLSYLLYDEPELVDAVFTHWGQKVYDYYATLIEHKAVGAIFHADNMGFKTSTLISPKASRRLMLPWLKKYADLAHLHGKIFCLHSDGNLYRGVSLLTRKTWSLAQSQQHLLFHVQWWRAYYHLVRPHASLRVPTIGGSRTYRDCTPAMALGITDHVWSVAEILRTPLVPGTTRT